jgi:hypothetical protein
MEGLLLYTSAMAFVGGLVALVHGNRYRFRMPGRTKHSRSTRPSTSRYVA